MDKNALIGCTDFPQKKAWYYKLNYQRLQKLQQNPSNHNRPISLHSEDFFIGYVTRRDFSIVIGELSAIKLT